MISRNAKILAATGAAVVLTGGAVGAAQLDKTVNLSVDGASSTSSFFGSRTVGDVLAGEGIEVKQGDVVVPATGSTVGDGESITVKYARMLNLTVDGKTRQIRTTETTVDGALLALGVRGDSRLSVSRSQTIGRQGLSLSIVTPKAVTVNVDGKTTTKTVAAATVGEALTQLGVRLGKADKVNPPVTTRLTNGAKVAVQRVQTKDTKTTQPIAFGTTRTKTGALYSDQTKVSRAGVAGTRVVTTRATVIDGKVVSRATIASTVSKAPVNRVLLVGTKSRPAPAPARAAAPAPAASTGGSSSGAGINLARASMWDSIAQCESTGNWHINTGNGYYGGLQFLTSTWLGYGGGDFASRADLASREQQITVANRVYADNGTSQWQCKP